MRRLLVVCLLAAACGSSNDKPVDAPGVDAAPPDVGIDAPVLPVFRHGVNLPDSTLASQALAILGAGTTNECGSCHPITRQQMYYWNSISATAYASCLTDLTVETQQSAQQMIDCMRTMPTVQDAPFQVTKLGVFASAARLPWFQYVFWKAYGDQGDAKLADFQSMMAMPRGSTQPALTQEQFDIVAEWFIRGIPSLEAVTPADGQPTDCNTYQSPDVQAHTDALKTTGWRQVNRDNLMAMYDCGAASDPRMCLQDKILASSQSYGEGWDLPGMGQIRVLDDKPNYSSYYWTRSSPDGRFIGHGRRDQQNASMIDLQRDSANDTFDVRADYDPGFFPDNSGWVFQGSTSGHNVCPQSVLTSDPTSVTMSEAGCNGLSSVGLYQHVGRALNNGDYFTIDSQFTSDEGGHSPTFGDPHTNFGNTAAAHFTPLILNGASGYSSKPRVTVTEPYEGDIVISPSATLALSRVAGANGRQLGYVLRKVNATPSGTSYSVTTPEIARYCWSGAKPAFSYDERWVVYHHYISNTAADAQELGFASNTDAGFQPYATKGTSNLYLLEFATGQKYRITNMQPGQYLLYPHFRSDGWIYAIVRDTNGGSVPHEYMVASDAALIAELPGAHPAHPAPAKHAH